MYEINKLSEEEKEKLLVVYNYLKDLSKSKIPTVRCNSRQALGFIWQVVVNMNLQYEHLKEIHE